MTILACRQNGFDNGRPKIKRFTSSKLSIKSFLLDQTFIHFFSQPKALLLLTA